MDCKNESSECHAIGNVNGIWCVHAERVSWGVRLANVVLPLRMVEPVALFRIYHCLRTGLASLIDSGCLLTFTLVVRVTV